jgi:hypothetical protein
MNRFKTSDRDQSMTHIVSFHNVPMPRGLAFAIHHIESHGATVSIASADRRMNVIAEHNKQFGTNLHGQAYLVSMHAQNPGQYAAANPPNRTSHCYFSDGSAAYQLNGKQIPPGGGLPWYMCGIDLDDRGKIEDASRFVSAAKKLGYSFVQPYSSGTERHHVVCVRSPISILEAANQISKNRQ